MLKKKEKTGYSEISVAAFITSGVLGVMPFCGVDVTTTQATNLGLFIAAGLGWFIRQYFKARN